MKKVNLASVLEVLLKEGQDQAGTELHKYFIERCAEINEELEEADDGVEIDDVSSVAPEVDDSEDDGADFGGEDDTSTDEGSGKVILTVIYTDPDGDCEDDQSIMDTIGATDMDGAGWAEGVRTLEFIFDDQASADAAADALENRDGGPENLQTDTTVISLDTPAEEGGDEAGTDDSTEDFGGEDDGDVTEDESSDGEESPISGSEDTSEDFGGEDDTSTDGEEETDGIFKDPEESDSDKIDYLAAEVEKLKAELESFQDLGEGFEYTPVKVKMTDDTEIGTGGKISSNDESLVPGNKDMDNRIAGEPIEIKDKPHSGYARETAPSFKTVDVGAKNVRKGVTDGTSKVSKEGDASAELNNKGNGFGSDSPGSIIDGK